MKHGIPLKSLRDYAIPAPLVVPDPIPNKLRRNYYFQFFNLQRVAKAQAPKIYVFLHFSINQLIILLQISWLIKIILLFTKRKRKRILLQISWSYHFNININIKFISISFNKNYIIVHKKKKKKKRIIAIFLKNFPTLSN